MGTLNYLRFSTTGKKTHTHTQSHVLALSFPFAKFISGGTKGEAEKKSGRCDENMTFANISEGHRVII